MDTLAQVRGHHFSYDEATNELLVLNEPIAQDILNELLLALQVDFDTYQYLLATEKRVFLTRIRTSG